MRGTRTASAAGEGLLAWRRGLSPDRLVPVGIGMAALTSAATTVLVLRRQYDIGAALVWLSGSPYGAELSDAIPVVGVVGSVGAGGAARVPCDRWQPAPPGAAGRRTLWLLRRSRLNR